MDDSNDNYDFGQNTFSRGPLLVKKSQDGFTIKDIGKSSEWYMSSNTAIQFAHWLVARVEKPESDPHYSGLVYLFDQKDTISHDCPHCSQSNKNFGCSNCGERFSIKAERRDEDTFWKLRRAVDSAERLVKILSEKTDTDPELEKAAAEFVRINNENKSQE